MVVGWLYRSADENEAIGTAVIGEWLYLGVGLIPRKV